MFIVQARHKGNGKHCEQQSETLDDALQRVREVITAEMNEPEGPRYWEYVVSFHPSLAAGQRPLEYHWPHLMAKAREKSAKRLAARQARRALPAGQQSKSKPIAGLIGPSASCSSAKAA